MTRRRRNWWYALVSASVAVTITAGACGRPLSTPRGPTQRPLPVKILSHGGLLVVQTGCRTINGPCYYSADFLAATSLDRLRELAWASGSRPTQQECAAEPPTVQGCWTTVPDSGHELFIGLLDNVLCASVSSATADLVGQDELELQVTYSGQCPRGGVALMHPHLALLSVPTTPLPAVLLTLRAARSVNGTSSQIGERVIDLRSPPGGFARVAPRRLAGLASPPA